VLCTNTIPLQITISLQIERIHPMTEFVHPTGSKRDLRDVVAEPRKVRALGLCPGVELDDDLKAVAQDHRDYVLSDETTK
jgi:hypothetical protein